MNAALYFHGGPAGRQRGHFLLPPTITKAASCSDFGAAHVHRRDRVYVTTSIEAAALYAAAHRSGVIYACEPIGPLEHDPDCSEHGLSYQCERAKVLRIIKLPKDVARRAQEILLQESEAA